MAAIGPVIGLILAGLLAASGTDGRIGFVAVMLGSAGGAAAAASVTLLQALVDEVRDRPPARRRPLTGFGLFAAAVVLMILASGAAVG